MSPARTRRRRRRPLRLFAAPDSTRDPLSPLAAHPPPAAPPSRTHPAMVIHAALSRLLLLLLLLPRTLSSPLRLPPSPIYPRWRRYHDGRPRGPLWRGKKMIGKEALKRFKDEDEKLARFCKTHVLRLLKMDKIAVLSELEPREEEVALAFKFPFSDLR